MSTHTFCPTGLMDGILVADAELTEFANTIGSKYIDEYIPLPDTEALDQAELVKACDCDNKEGFDHAIYWERSNGKHGWCCNECGKVIQWG